MPVRWLVEFTYFLPSERQGDRGNSREHARYGMTAVAPGYRAYEAWKWLLR